MLREILTKCPFPPTIIEMKKLDLTLWNSESLGNFKNGILKYIRPTLSRVINCGSRLEIKLITRLCLELSRLCKQKLKCNFQNCPIFNYNRHTYSYQTHLFLTQSLTTFYLLKDLNNIFKNIFPTQSFFICLFVYYPVTIHPSLYQYLHRLDPTQGPILLPCRLNEQDLNDWLCECPAGDAIRQQVFGNQKASLEWLATRPRDVVAYARKTLVNLDA